MPTFGLEEEVFITEPLRPSLCSLFYLSRLLWRSPGQYYVHSAHNFARGADVKYGLMSGVEISTGIHSDVAGLISEWKTRRAELANAAQNSLVVAMGHLLQHPTPSNVCGLQMHIGGLDDFDKAYQNLIRYLPLLILLTASSPGCDDMRAGMSLRGLSGYATGPLREDRLYRFQDIIYSRRLGTIELRIFDPVWDAGRVELLARLVSSIIDFIDVSPQDINEYNRLRLQALREGYTAELQTLYNELRNRLPYDLDEVYFASTAADQIWEYAGLHGVEAAYRALDGGFRTGEYKELPTRRYHGKAVRMAGALAGFSGYFLPRLPYYVYKGVAEWKKRPPTSLEKAD